MDHIQEFLFGLVATAFGGWAIVVWWGVRAVVERIDRITSAVGKLDKDLNTWVHSTEHRLSTIEEWKNHVDRHLN